MKIDRSFFSGFDRSRQDQTIVEAIAILAAGFDLEVIVEGIETEAQASLMEQFCDEGQGYLYGRPMTASRFEIEALKPDGSAATPTVVSTLSHNRLL